MKLLLKAFLAAALLGATSGALSAATIELKDGGRIQGEIQSIQNGVYTVASPSMGTLHVAQSNIVRIDYGDGRSNDGSASGKSTARNDELTRQTQQLQKQLAQDPELMKMIMSLQSDPQIQAILNDPALVQAIQQGDYMSLLDNPKIQALESNAVLKQLLQQHGQ